MGQPRRHKRTEQNTAFLCGGSHQTAAILGCLPGSSDGGSHRFRRASAASTAATVYVARSAQHRAAARGVPSKQHGPQGQSPTADQAQDQDGAAMPALADVSEKKTLVGLRRRAPGRAASLGHAADPHRAQSEKHRGLVGPSSAEGAPGGRRRFIGVRPVPVVLRLRFQTFLRRDLDRKTADRGHIKR